MKIVLKKLSLFVVMFMVVCGEILTTESKAATLGNPVVSATPCGDMLNVVSILTLTPFVPCENFSFSYFYDDDNHWLKCIKCFSDKEKKPHEYKNGKCECGKKEPAKKQETTTNSKNGKVTGENCSKNHGKKYIYRYNDVDHWLACPDTSCANYPKVKDKTTGAKHSYDKKTGLCVCGKQNPKPSSSNNNSNNSNNSNNNSAANPNSCPQCGKLISNGWLPDDAGNHYKVCMNGHKNNLAPHQDNNLNAECDICDNPMVCFTCKTAFKPGWLSSTEKHFKECANGHHSYIESHKDTNSDGFCDICQVTTCYCGASLNSEWIDNGAGKHYQKCLNGHPNNESVHYDGDYNLVCDLCKVSITTCTTCAAKLKDGWIPDEKGQHYRECQSGHQSYKAPHYDGNLDLMCDLCKVVVATCSTCGGDLKEGWQRDEENHYKECTSGHRSYVAPHLYYGTDKCSVCETSENVVTPENNPTTSPDNTPTDTPESTPAASALFTDLPSDHWAYNEVKSMVNLGIVNGRGDGSLGTNDKITTEEFVALLSRISVKLGLSKAEGEAYLQDKVTGWSQKEYITLMQVIGAKANEKDLNLGKKEMQLLLGNTEEEFLANYKLPIAREKVAGLLGLFVEDGIENPNNVLKAKDWSSVNSIYRGRINELAERDIFRGSKELDGIYIKPKDSVSRAEAIALINRLYSNKKSSNF